MPIHLVDVKIFLWSETCCWHLMKSSGITKVIEILVGNMDFINGNSSNSSWYISHNTVFRHYSADTAIFPHFPRPLSGTSL